MALIHHHAAGFVPLCFSESPELPDELNYDDLVDDLSSCSGSVNEVLDQIDLESLRSGSVNAVLDLLEEDYHGDKDICSLDIEDVDIPEKASINNPFNQNMKVKYLKACDSQQIPRDTISARNEPPTPTIRSVKGNQYRFGLIGANIKRDKGAACHLKTRQNDLKQKKEPYQTQGHNNTVCKGISMSSS